MKKIVVFGGSKAHPSMVAFTQELAAGFCQLGKQVFYCDRSSGESVNQMLDLMQGGEVAFSVGLNDFGMEYPLPDGTVFRLFEMFDIPHASVMLDVPYNVCVSGFESTCRRHLVTLLDRSLASYLKLVYPDYQKNVLFMPLGGSCAANQGNIITKPRTYDVVMCAYAWGRNALKRVWHREDVSTGKVHILDDVADYMECHAVNTWQAMQHVLQQRGMLDEAYMREMVPYCWDILRYIKMYRRVRAIDFLTRNDIPVDIFGGGWEDMPLGKNVRLHGEIGYAEAMDVIANAKMLFQDQAEFNNGAHDRVFSGMLNGTVVVSEYSTYLEEEFINGQDIFLYDWQHGENQVGVITDLLQDEAKRQAVAVSAYGKADSNHRWKNRCEYILEAMELLYGV